MLSWVVDSKANREGEMICRKRTQGGGERESGGMVTSDHPRTGNDTLLSSATALGHHEFIAFGIEAHRQMEWIFGGVVRFAV